METVNKIFYSGEDFEKAMQTLAVQQTKSAR